MSTRDQILKKPTGGGATLGIGIMATAVVFAGCYFLHSVFLPIMLSYLLFVLLEPMVAWCEKKGFSRTLCSSLLVLLVVAFSTLVSWGAYSTCARLANQIPQYSEKIKTILSSLQDAATKFQEGSLDLMPDSQIKDDVQKVEVIKSFSGGRLAAVLSGVNSGFELLTIAFFIPLLALFFLLDKPYLRGRLQQAVGHDVPLEKIGGEVSQMMQSFFIGNLIVGLLTALGFYILFAFMGLENQLVLAMFAGFVNLIPVIGSILGGLLPALQAFMQFSNLTLPLVVMGGSIFLHFFIANFIMPKVVGSKINVNASAATVGLIFWGWIWGPIGLLFAIPLTAFVRILLSATPSLHHWAGLIAEKPFVPLHLRKVARRP